MRTTINGVEKEIDEATSVLRLLEVEDVESPDMVAVQLNGTIVDRSQYAQTTLENGDVVEFLYFMGGGA